MTEKRRGRPVKIVSETTVEESFDTTGPIQAEPDAPPLDPPDSLEERKRRSISVVERRLGGDALFGRGSTAIPLRDPEMIARWFNRAISADKFYKAEHEKGWIKVTLDDVANKDAVAGYTITPERYITRGTRGEEMLYMISKQAWDKIRWAKDAANRSRLSSKDKRKHVVAEGVAAQYGSQAADFIYAEGGPVVESWRGTGDDWSDRPEE